MPLNKKGKKIMKAMKKQYGAEEGEAVFYASKNKGVIDDVERKALGGSVKSKKEKLAAIAEPFDEVTQRDVITARREKLKFKDGKSVNVDIKKLPRSMRERKYGFGFSENGGIRRGNPEEVKENRKPKTKEERAGGKNPTDEQRIKARFADDDRKEFEKKVQGKMGSFESGGVVKAAILIMDSGPQPEKAQVKGTKFSGNY